jgi:hypothetical protein
MYIFGVNTVGMGVGVLKFSKIFRIIKRLKRVNFLKMSDSPEIRTIEGYFNMNEFERMKPERKEKLEE